MNKKGFLFAVLIVSALVIGSLIVHISSPNGIFGTCISLGLSNAEPLVIDLVVLKLTIGLSINVGLAHVIMLIFAIIVYPFIAKNLD